VLNGGEYPRAADSAKGSGRGRLLEEQSSIGPPQIDPGKRRGEKSRPSKRGKKRGLFREEDWLAKHLN